MGLSYGTLARLGSGARFQGNVGQRLGSLSLDRALADTPWEFGDTDRDLFLRLARWGAADHTRLNPGMDSGPAAGSPSDAAMYVKSPQALPNTACVTSAAPGDSLERGGITRAIGGIFG